jgi:Tol biopolymer transport system component
VNAPTTFDRVLSDWLEAEAPSGAPAGLHDSVIERAGTMRQRRRVIVVLRAGTQLRHRDDELPSRRPWLLVAAALVVGTSVIGAALVGGRLITPKPGPTLLNVVPNPTISASPAPEASPSAQPEPAVFVFNEGAGTAAECADAVGGCIPRMWVATLDGAGARELLPGQSGCQRAVAWSPDGTRLLFSRSECHVDTAFGGMIGAERFYLTDASGSEPQLVDTGCVDLCVSENDAVFSADGLRILFVRTRSIPPAPSATDPVTGKPAQGTEVRVLASIDIATDRVTELGDFDECPGGCGSGPPRSDPIWSPDRTQILYTWAPWTYGPQPPAGAAVLVADADGRNVLQLSASGGTPAWSLDGTRIAFRSERYSWKGTWKPGVVVHAFFDIYTIRPDGSDLVRLTSDGVSLNPEWSPDGRIWYIRVLNPLNADEPAQSWVMGADGSNAIQLSAAQLSSRPPFQAWQIQPTP